MKKIFFSMIISMLLLGNAVFAESVSPTLKYAIKQYKAKNYIGALQTLQKYTENDPGNALGHYYLGMCYVRIGDKQKANEEYTKVITLSPSSELASNAALGMNNISDTPQQETKPDITTTVNKTKEFLSDEAKTKLQEKNIKSIIENVNGNREISPDVYKRLPVYDNKKSDASTSTPSAQEIVDAMKTLSKAGINPSTVANAYPSTPQMNPEMMQLNMLMSSMGGGGSMYGGSSSNNNSMNMLPMLMMMQGQGGAKVDPETIQVMMSQMMMPNMGLYDSNNNNNNNY